MYVFVFGGIECINECMCARIIRIFMVIILDIGNIERCLYFSSFFLFELLKTP